MINLPDVYATYCPKKDCQLLTNKTQWQLETHNVRVRNYAKTTSIELKSLQPQLIFFLFLFRWKLMRLPRRSYIFKTLWHWTELESHNYVNTPFVMRKFFSSWQCSFQTRWVVALDSFQFFQDFVVCVSNPAGVCLWVRVITNGFYSKLTLNRISKPLMIRRCVKIPSNLIFTLFFS